MFLLKLLFGSDSSDSKKQNASTGKKSNSKKSDDNEIFKMWDALDDWDYIDSHQ